MSGNFKRSIKLFAVSQPGIEEITAKELEGLGIKGTVVPGGVEFEGDLEVLYRANLWLRTASRILVRLCTFRAKHFAELIRKAQKCPWNDFITPDLPLKIRATSRKSKLYHSKAIEERVWKAIIEAVGFEPQKVRLEDEGTSVIVRFENDICTISINSSGAMLHKRGYRVKETQAPLRETLAAAMVLVSGWKGKTPLIDPFCGSGTIPIEAAMIAANVPPGINRGFAFMKWKNFDEDLWKSIKKEAISKIKEVKVPIIGYDIDPDAIEAARKNAEVTRVSKFIRFENLSFPEVSFDAVTIVTNPPYGVRLPIKNVREIYRRFGDWIERHFKDYRVLFLSPNKKLAELTGLNSKLITFFSNGGITVGLYEAGR
ncbi:class I SAM-dependent RNA methyltransferase [Desulfurobacterium thermolithotrophum]|uniref:THUMP domain-containing class I SAM-dependent RNA methyltransferase n=1 Tax=Desulfurobacterium thermolithotrophum TaxID=64160 RepID=UPI0013D856FD|nr:class I SAM-dependent RNA methyltransferase [Desulfurobacterium thermolithotrophum]